MTEDEISFENRASLIIYLERPAGFIAAADDRSVDLEKSVGGQDVEVRARRCQFAERFEPLGEKRVVGVQEDDEIPFCRVERTVVLGPCLAGVLLDGRR